MFTSSKEYLFLNKLVLVIVSKSSKFNFCNPENFISLEKEYFNGKKY